MLRCQRSTIPPHQFPRVSISISKFPGQRHSDLDAPWGRRELSMRSGLRAVTLSACFFLLIGSLAWSQVATTSVKGTVYDANGAVVAQATVTLENPSTGF